MRILKIFLTTLLSVSLVVSVSLAIMLGTSSTSIGLLNKDTMDTRVKLYYSTSDGLKTAKEITIQQIIHPTVNPVTNKEETPLTYLSIITCQKNKENVGSAYECSMIAKLYKSEMIDSGKLSLTSFIPGDGYMYTDNAETNKKTKEPFANAGSSNSLAAYLDNAITSLSLRASAYLVEDYLDNKSILNYSYDTKLKFDFNTFSLNKEITATYKHGETTKKYLYQFDKYDRLTYFYRDDVDTEITISYSKEELSFPASYDDYVQ